MKLLNKITAAICGAAMLAGIGQAVAGEDDGVFTIAYAPNESTTQSADARNGLAKDLGAFLGCEVEEIQSTDYNAIVEALRTGKADMAYMGSQALALGVTRSKMEPIVMKAADGDKAKAIYHSVFIVNSANKDINSIQDFKGKTIAFVDPGSTSGNLVPRLLPVLAGPVRQFRALHPHTASRWHNGASVPPAGRAKLRHRPY